jgi:GxxExxY protein
VRKSTAESAESAERLEGGRGGSVHSVSSSSSLSSSTTSSSSTSHSASSATSAVDSPSGPSGNASASSATSAVDSPSVPSASLSPRTDEGADLTGKVIGAAIAVHRALGPGLLESAYRACLAWELEHAGLRVAQEVPLPVTYRGHLIDCGYRLDLVVEDALIVELKAVDRLAPIHDAQLLTYLRLSGARLGLLFNFNVPVLKDGIRRFALTSSTAPPGSSGVDAARRGPR